MPNIDEYIDRKELNERLDSDIELFRDLTDIFINDADNLLNEIQKAIDSQDSEKLRKSSHTLKGAVANFSAKPAYDSAFALEKIGKSGDLNEARDAFESLKKNISDTISALKDLAEKSALV